MTWEIRIGHVLPLLRRMLSNSVQCVVTSPPYWGLRAYGTDPQVWGGDPACAHDFGDEERTAWANKVKGPSSGGKNGTAYANTTKIHGAFCCKCQAWRGELGLEPTPELFIEHLVEVFREVRRVLRPDGVCFINIGDTYATGAGKSRKVGKHQSVVDSAGVPMSAPNRMKIPGLKKKDRIGIPHRLVFALQADGWFWRDEIIWHKPNVMPSSVCDRTTAAHEMVFMLTKSATYFYDHVATQEKASGTSHTRGKGVNPKAKVCDRVPGPERKQNESFSAAISGLVETRNLRSVWRLKVIGKRVLRIQVERSTSIWSISTRGYKGAHFATFPPALLRPMILAGTSERGCCPVCGVPWRRKVERERVATRPGRDTKIKVPSGWNTGEGRHDTIEGRYTTPDGKDAVGKRTYSGFNARYKEEQQAMREASEVGNRDPERHISRIKTIGWAAGCNCGATHTRPCLVLDPFCGSGTTLAVAGEMGRNSIGLELKPEYAELATKRLEGK